MNLKPINLPQSLCLGCGTDLDAANAVAQPLDMAMPRPGDFTVCIKCGHVMAFTETLTLREMTDTEMHAIAGDERLLIAQEIAAEYRKDHSQ
jgi:hypothetical protein